MNNEIEKNLTDQCIFLNKVELLPCPCWEKDFIQISEFVDIIMAPILISPINPMDFNNAIWNILEISKIKPDFVLKFGVSWSKSKSLAINVSKAVFIDFFKLESDYVDDLFFKCGWNKINDSYFINDEYFLNFEYFTKDFITLLVKNSNEAEITIIAQKLIKSLIFLLKNEKKQFQLLNSINNEMIELPHLETYIPSDDIIEFPTFPNNVRFLIQETNLSSNIEKFRKNDFLFNMKENYHGKRTVLFVPNSIPFTLVSKSIRSQIDFLRLLSEKFDFFKISLINAIFSSSSVNLNHSPEFTLESTFEHSSTYSLEIISILLDILNDKLPKFDDYSFIILSPLFDDSINLFSFSDDYQKILYLRENYIKLIFNNISNKEEEIDHLFSSIQIRPIAFVEFLIISSRCTSVDLSFYFAKSNIYYFSIINSLIKKSIQSKSDFYNIEKISNEQEFYWLYNIIYNSLDSISQRKINAINYARLSILSYFQAKIESHQIIDKNALILLISNLFELPIQKYVFYLFSNLGIEAIKNDILCIFPKIFLKTPKNFACILIGNNLIDFMINNINLFHVYVSQACHWITLIKNNYTSLSIMQKLVLNLISLLLSSVHYQKNTNKEMDELEHVCLKYFACKINDLLLMKLLSLAAGKPIQIVSLKFSIVNARAIKIIILVYFEERIFDFLNELCKDSLKNCFQFSKYGIDNLLLDFLYENRNNLHVDLHLYKSILNVIISVTSHISSMKTTLKFISLFSPINTNHCPHYLPLFYDALNQISLRSHKYPSVSIPLSKNSLLYITNVSSSIINEDVTFSFWIYIKNVQSNLKCLFSVDDEKGKKLVVYIKETDIIVNIHDNGSAWSGKSTESLLIDRWQFFTVSFKIHQKTGFIIVSLMINRNEANKFLFSSTGFSENKSIKIIIGGNKYNPNVKFNKNEILSSNIILGPIGFYPSLNESNFIVLKESNPNIPPFEAFFYSVPVKVDDLVTFIFYKKNFGISKGINGYFEPIHFQQNASLINIILDQNKVDYLIPLFALDSIKFDNDYKNDISFFQLSINILINIFPRKESAQNSFANSRGFDMIYYLLIKSKIKINFCLYKRFIALYEILIDAKCQKQLLNDILFSIELWIKCKDFHRILRNWQKVLLPQHYDVLLSKYSIMSLLTILRVYLWIDPIEENIINVERNFDIDHVKLCRNILFQIIYKSNNFCEVDIEGLISHSISCPDTQQVCDLIDFSNELIYNNSLSFSIDFDTILPMHFLIFSNNSQIIQKTIIFFIKLHLLNAIKKISLANHIELICMHLPNIDNKEEFLEKKLLSLFCPEILPLCLLIALQSKKDYCMEKVCRFLSIKQSPTFTSTESWYFWPIVSLFLYENVYNLIVHFLALCPCNDWSTIYTTINIVSKVLCCSNYEPIHLFLLDIATQLINHYEKRKAEIFFRIVAHFLFIKQTYIYDQAKCDDFHSLEINDIYQKFRKLDNVTANEHYGVRIDKKGLFLDSDLALVAVNLYEKYPITEFEEFVILICAYHLEFDAVPIEKLKSLSITNSNALAVYDSRAISLGCKRLTNDSIYDVILGNKLFIEEFDKNHVDYFYDLNSNKALEYVQNHLKSSENNFRMHILEKFMNLANNLIRKLIDTDEMTISSFSKIWKSFWQNSLNEGIPWHYQSSSFYSQGKAKNNDVKEKHNIFGASRVHYKRDNTYCYAFCPFKLIKNEKFISYRNKSKIKAFLGVEKDENVPLKTELNLERFNSSSVIKKRNSIESSDKQPEFDENHLYAKDIPEIVIYETNKCQLIRINKKSFVPFYVTKDKISIGKENIKMDEISHVFLRSIRHQQTAIEIFVENGNSYLLNFVTLNKQNLTSLSITQLLFPFIKKQQNIQISSNSIFFESKLFTKKWVNREISNFEYLMLLNIHCGRSFNDSSIYPVMPWIISDYDSYNLDLLNKNSFRDLSLPIGAIGEKRFEQLDLSYKRANKNDIAFLYSSWLICPLTLYLWLVRLEPFTSQHLKMHDGKFDHANRQFSSMKIAYKLCTTSANDFRELIPEFFFNPDILVNHNKFNIGKEDDGNVKLPNWAETPFDFIYKHRKALECEKVSLKLNKWIDLVFGCNQRSYEAKNVYCNEIYSDIWDSINEKNPKNENHINTILDLVGQIPQPLFNIPHPIRQAKHLNNHLRKEWLSFETKLFNNKNIKLSFIHKNTNKEYYIFAIENLEYKVTQYQIKQKKVIFKENFQITEKQHNTKQFTPDGFVLTSLNEFSIFLNNKTQRYTLQNCPISKIYKVASSNLYVAASDNNTNIYIFKKRITNNPFCSFSILKGSVKHVAISDVFQLCVCGSKYSFLILISLNSKEIVKYIHFEKQIDQNENDSPKKILNKHFEKPTLILITPSWGFILVCSSIVINTSKQYFVRVYSVNGDFIRKAQLNKKVRFWVSWKTKDGFDNLLISDKHNVYFSEAYYIAFNKPILSFSETIVGIDYLQEIEKAVVILDTCRTIVLDLLMNELK
ncbi:hypothetical protein TRFO_19249 [Tritrichomonas foetus]|uniref:Beige/BEACH domain containing protein n=1 Tax=Tritrichomonas foetus TaxID=1144522 RepID=A0A1J4KK80_9EUKA|nr:hypothetical protein TRFO_19249 [Tritrichomonas foetus]|eukprot:OHT11360.1 hypothetical protein TRFO_19249 [Tritrichomonas foetus]